MLKIGLVVDAGCDLPDAYLEAHGIRILPSMLQCDGKSWLDERDPAQTMMLYRRYIADRSIEAQSSACSAAEIREIFLQELVVDYDRVLVITAGAAYTDMFARATEASYGILQSYRERRAEQSHTGGFSLRVLDTGSLCAGEAVLVCRALQLLDERRLAFEAMRRQLRDEAARTSCMLVPGDPWYLRHRGLDGRNSGLPRGAYALGLVAGLRPVIEIVGGRQQVIARPRGFQAACAAALARAERAVRRAPGAPALVLSFGGDPRVIREMPAYRELEASAASAGIELHVSVMSATMGARLGPGTLSVAWLDPA